MRFSKDFPDQLRSQILTSDIVGKKVALKKRGRDYLGLCPFHNEKTPSFVVNDQKGFYHCFGCSAHGDIVSFVMSNEGLDFKEAVVKLANDHGIKIPLVKLEQDQDGDQASRYYQILEQICQYFEHNLYEYSGSAALDYLSKRNLNREIIKKFRLGFSLSSYDALTDYLKKKNFTEEELLKSGVVSKNANKLYDRFRGRVIFPIDDRSGRIIAFGGRIIGDGQPKYLNSSETEFFKKGYNLYNYSRARKAIYEQKFAVIVEGYMDVISLSNYKIDNVVAPLGTAITAEQIKELFKITSDIVVFLDGDNAGISAMRRVIDISLPILSSKNVIRFAFLPQGMDPDDFVRLNGSKATENLLLNAKNLSEVLFEYEAKDLGIITLDRSTSPEKKAILEKKLLEKINFISEPSTKKYFLQYYRNILFDFTKRYKTVVNFGAQKFFSSDIINKIGLSDSSSVYAASIVSLLIKYPQLISYKNEYYDIRELSFYNEELTNLKELLIDFYDNNPDFKSGAIIDFLDRFADYKNLKDKIPSPEKIANNLNEARLKLEIFSLRFYYEQICQQYREMADLTDNIETDSISIKEGGQKSLFDHKTTLEKKIAQLENKLFEN